MTVSLVASDEAAGVKEIHVRVEQSGERCPDVAYIDPGEAFVLPPLTEEGDYEITYFAVDRLGNPETPQRLVVRVDLTAPTIAGLPPQPCVIWPPEREDGPRGRRGRLRRHSRDSLTWW